MGLSTEKRINEQPRAVNISSAVSPITRETASNATERNAKLRYEGYKKLSEM